MGMSRRWRRGIAGSSGWLAFDAGPAPDALAFAAPFAVAEDEGLGGVRGEDAMDVFGVRRGGRGRRLGEGEGHQASRQGWVEEEGER